MEHCDALPTPNKVDAPLGKYDGPKSYASIIGMMLHPALKKDRISPLLFINVASLHITPSNHMRCM